MYGIKSFEIKKFKPKGIAETLDLVVIEEPLEIRLGFGEEDNRQQKSISVTMRTPTGHDFELSLGFLFTEGIISSFDDILAIHYCTDAGRQAEPRALHALRRAVAAFVRYREGAPGCAAVSRLSGTAGVGHGAGNRDVL